ncbi:MAG: hypothetical protein ACR2MA_05430 [Egibacteraceae bacterium]
MGDWRREARRAEGDSLPMRICGVNYFGPECQTAAETTNTQIGNPATGTVDTGNAPGSAPGAGPDQPPGPDAPPPPDPAELAAEAWTRLPLPAPDPFIDPGWAITGLRSCLQTGSSLEPITATIATPAGPLALHVTSHYTVTWGEGEPETHGVEGGPWPDGDITHLYQTVGYYDVTVTQVFRARWRPAGTNGPWRPLPTTRTTSSTIPDFTVTQIQAVRRR